MITNRESRTDLGFSSSRIFSSRYWGQYPVTYRAQEMQVIASWIANGDSGSVIGLPGIGRSTLLGFLYHRPDALTTYLMTLPGQIAIIPVDLNILPDYTIATLYRVVLRSFYQARHQFTESLQQTITRYYAKNEAVCDPFLPQSALLELLTLFQQHKIRTVWVLNNFDEFCIQATPEMIRTLRGLRDSFKETLCYIVGMLREAIHLPDVTFVEPLLHILDVNICQVGPLNRIDAQNMILWELQTAKTAVTSTDINVLSELTGGNPALIRIACQWWLSTTRKPSPDQWLEALLNQREVQRRLGKIWDNLTQEEQFALSELQKFLDCPTRRPREMQNVVKQHQDILERLQEKGICQLIEGRWCILGTLFATYVADTEGRGRGRIWLNEETDELYQGHTLLDSLAPLEHATLRLFTKHPRVRHSYTDIIEAVWPEDIQKAGVSTEALYQVIRGVRKKIEPNPSNPVYVLNWRGQPEGGYQFFPEGRPGE